MEQVLDAVARHLKTILLAVVAVALVDLAALVADLVPEVVLGGSGATWTYTGPTVYYAGGGGSGSAPWLSMPGAGTGGLGGGGAGSTTSAPGTPGTAGTGGGGGSSASVQPSGSGGNGGAGGSGVVIIAVPNAKYPGSAPGAIVSTPPSAPGMTVLTYTTPNPTTPGSFTYTA